MFLQELLDRQRHEYVCREQTLLWKNSETDEYRIYTSVILETFGFNRFDYSAFNHGHLPTQHNIDVIVYTCQMKEKKTSIGRNTFLLDSFIWYPEYTKWKTTFRNVF